MGTWFLSEIRQWWWMHNSTKCAKTTDLCTVKGQIALHASYVLVKLLYVKTNKNNNKISVTPHQLYWSSTFCLKALCLPFQPPLSSPPHSAPETPASSPLHRWKAHSYIRFFPHAVPPVPKSSHISYRHSELSLHITSERPSPAPQSKAVFPVTIRHCLVVFSSQYLSKI